MEELCAQKEVNVASSSRGIYWNCGFAPVLEVIEIACCHKGLYIGICKSAVCIPREEYLVLLMLQGLDVACQIS